ncbi:hypothetical protein E3N88_14573 [Mikania micrantha]|uniref:Small ribosomal subunit protein uS7 domain-containing protein n=1 Tax=Mikania micrantha TaxID=192012 RepID=A0A5N6P3S2_9ASTR|nr:hypothetical protein E3N88_14573 [Mikania micrantha]
MKKIQQKTEINPLSVLRQAIHGVTPGIAVKARRVGGSTHQVPIEIGSTQGKALAIRWLLAASRKRPGRNMAFKLSSELVDAANGQRQIELLHIFGSIKRFHCHQNELNRSNKIEVDPLYERVVDIEEVEKDGHSELKPFENLKSFIDVPKYVYESLPSYMKCLVSREDLLAAVEKMNLHLKEKTKNDNFLPTKKFHHWI